MSSRVEAKAVFSTVKDHLLKQNRKAVNASGSCMYRAPNGDRCAVGCLIPDHAYKTDFEGSGIGDIAEEALPDWDENMIFMLSDLQSVHDTHDPEKWSVLLDELEGMWGLKDDETPTQAAERALRRRGVSYTIARKGAIKGAMVPPVLGEFDAFVYRQSAGGYTPRGFAS